MKITYLTVAALLGFNLVFAQKTLQTQQTPLAIPQQFKADGQLKEWSDPLAAHNKKVELSYSIANDDKQLVFVIKAADRNVIKKIILGGISFSINLNGDKKEKDAQTITYPQLYTANNFMRSINNNRDRRQLTASSKEDVAALAKEFSAELAKAKEIGITGISAVTDTLISIYNAYGIKTKAIINNELVYTQELVIPFAVLGIDANTLKEFTYQIKLNGRTTPANMFVSDISTSNFPTPTPNQNRGNARAPRAGNASQQDYNSATSFWAKYTLHQN